MTLYEALRAAERDLMRPQPRERRLYLESFCAELRRGLGDPWAQPRVEIGVGSK